MSDKPPFQHQRIAATMETVKILPQVGGWDRSPLWARWRLLLPGCVAKPRKTYGYRCSLRRALTKNPSFLPVTSSMQHCTSKDRDRLKALADEVKELRRTNEILHWPVRFSLKRSRTSDSSPARFRGQAS